MLRTGGFTKVEILSTSFHDDIAFDPSGEMRPNHITLHAWK
jgi:hypothetical protein